MDIDNFMLEGLIAAPVTPMRVEGDVNCNLIPATAALLIANGVSGAFVCGTTGESLSLSVSERKAVAESWKGCVGDELKLIVHVGQNSVVDAMELAAHAQEIGADAIACMAPSFLKPQSVEQLVDFCMRVAGAAPQLPFYFYHIPCITGVEMPVYNFLKCASSQIPTLRGVKFTYENLMDFARCVQLDGGRYNMLFGRDEMLLSGLATGADGAVGTTFNFAAPLYHQIIKAFHQGELDVARALQERANTMIAVLIRYGGNPAVAKAFMKYIGLDCGGVRTPLQSLDAATYANFASDLKDVDFASIASRLR